MCNFRLLLCAALVLIGTTSSAFAVSFDEKISGDIDTFSSWRLDVGNNVFAGTISIGNFFGDHQYDLDGIDFFLPYGYKATLSLNVNSLTFTDTLSTLGWNLLKQPGSCDRLFLGQTLCSWEGQYQPVASASYEKDQAGKDRVNHGAPSLAVPVLLDSGPYRLRSYSMQLVPLFPPVGINFLLDGTMDDTFQPPPGSGGVSFGGTMDYTFHIQVSAIPEPSKALLLSVGIIFASILRTLRGHTRSFRM